MPLQSNVLTGIEPLAVDFIAPGDPGKDLGDPNRLNSNSVSETLTAGDFRYPRFWPSPLLIFVNFSGFWSFPEI